MSWNQNQHNFNNQQRNNNTNNNQRNNNNNKNNQNGFSLAFAPPPMTNNNQQPMNGGMSPNIVTGNNFNGGPGPSYNANSNNSYFQSYAAFDPYGLMGGSLLNMPGMMNGSMMNMNMQNMQNMPNMQPNPNNLANADPNSFAMTAPIVPMASMQSQSLMNMNMMNPMPMNQRIQSSPHLFNNPNNNNMHPPPPPTNNNQYGYDQQLSQKKQRKKKRKKRQQQQHSNNNLGDYGLMAPKPRTRQRGQSKDQQKITSKRIRHSFLMTKHSGTADQLFGANANSSSNSKGAQTGFKRNANAPYSESRRKKVSYSRKETEKMKTKLLSSDKNMKKLHEVNVAKDINKLIMKKIHLCKYVCDFRAAESASNITLEVKREQSRIANKSALLGELENHFRRNSNWPQTMGKDLYKFLESLFKMISHNLFRVLPDSNIREVVKTDNTGKDAKITITKEIPHWVHLDLIYKIFICVLSKLKDDKGNKQMLMQHFETFNIISNVIYLLNTEEVREEEAVANVISLLYGEYKPVRMFVLGQLSNVCYSYLYVNNMRQQSESFEKNKDQRAYNKQLAIGVKTVLIIFRDCLETSDKEEIDGWVELLCQVIIPLHKAPIEEFVLFDDALARISITFCEKYFLSFVYIFNGMLRYWPITSSKKEQLFLHRIYPLLDKADEDCWEFKDKKECEFRDVFTLIANKIVDSIANYQHTHYATAEKIAEMLEDDTLQRFVDIYGGKDCWIKLYKGCYDIKSKYFWKETMDKVTDFMDLMKEEDDIPMQYVDEYEAIESNQHSVYNAEINPYSLEQRRIDQKRMKRAQYWQLLDKKFQKKNVATYQQHVYNNNQPMMQYNKKQKKNKHKHKQKKVQMKPPPAPPMNNGGVGLPPPVPQHLWDDDDF